MAVPARIELAHSRRQRDSLPLTDGTEFGTSAETRTQVFGFGDRHIGRYMTLIKN